MVSCAFKVKRRLTEVRLFLPLLIAVGLVTKGAAMVAVNTHLAIPVVAVEGAAGFVDRN